MSFELKNPDQKRRCWIVKGFVKHPADFWFKDVLNNDFTPDEGFIWAAPVYKIDSSDEALGHQSLTFNKWEDVLEELPSFGIFLTEGAADAVCAARRAIERARKESLELFMLRENSK